ncbi:MAG: thioredoxin domain-containing protein [Candidatus Kerfeldbacteria bacterium]|nr:thioredoxin domain-containing protein [Candidatus Kerfeldbacteria bacterium]
MPTQPPTSTHEYHTRHAFWAGFITAIGMSAIAVIIVSIGIVAVNKEHAANNINSNEQEVATNAPVNVEPIDAVDLNNIRYSTSSGDLTFIEYLDLESSFSKKYYEEIKNLEARYDGRIRFVVKHFPLNVHPTSKQDAIAAECAGNQDKFLEYIDGFFAQTPPANGFTETTLLSVANTLSLDAQAFSTCLENEETLFEVAQDALEATASGATGTPHSILVDKNGKILTRFKGVVSTAQLQQTFDETLQK